ncbi:type I-D CRISPR-associated protein Cas10d/Csc3 [Halorussus pelagicus]|uniref:type I-D CRISPR-associated protein Cas10d/Csc3 n=1 Tax=Halorussus pelagicus TaxID=2505977 RepID=UPI000FFC1BCA|nr:type I-D CRISPR-associated protein Cas10d/Csc3 [Halorussus pelagicus]
MTKDERLQQISPALENFDHEGKETEEDAEETRSTTQQVLETYRTEIDPLLVNEWAYESAKSVEYNKTDQSLVSHVRNGVFALAQINEAIEEFGGYELDETDLRDTIALFVVHDLHKLDAERDEDPDSRFDIPKSEVEEYVEKFQLGSFAENLRIEDFHSCAIDHHDHWTANHDQTTRRFDKLRPFVRLADSLASSETPEDATSDRTQNALDAAYPGSDFVFRRHVLDDVKGVLTNLVNAAVGDLLTEYEYRTIAIYQDGCVYLAQGDAVVPDVDDAFVDDLFDHLKADVQSSHPAYQDPKQLTGNLATRSQGFYGINAQDFFYTGPRKILEAVALKAISDADPESDPTDSMADAMAELEAYLPFDIERTREPVGLARFVYTVRRAFIDPVLNESDEERSSLEVTCDVFDVPDGVRDGLLDVAENDDVDLKAGGKWDYAYGIGQFLLNDGVTDYRDLGQRVIAGLDVLDDDWEPIVETAQAGNIRTELRAYLADVVSVEGRPLPQADTKVSDPFEEYHGKRRGKTCVLCNRGTTSTRKSDIEAPKSLSTLQAGYSNHVPVDAGKPDNLLVCIPCQVEFSLRETGSSRREAGRLFIHLVPDYFYTPLSWQSYSRFADEMNGERRTELGRLAEAVLDISDDGDALAEFMSALADEETGRSMVESLSQDFEPARQYGAQTLSYFKPKDNETEFQFFGVFVALALGAYASLRVHVSESPVPDLRGRDFREFAHIGGGFTQVHDFYGSSISLSDLDSRLRAAAALVRLGYGSERNDALFAKFLRVTRNEFLPGSHLLKRIAQADDGRNAQYLLEEARILDERTGMTINSDTMTSDTIRELAERAFDVIRPVQWNDKPYAIERVFRESVKAVKEFGPVEMSRQDAIDAVAGRVGKLPGRSEQVHRVKHEDSDHGGTYDERVEYYAEFFVDEVLHEMFDGKPSRLKRRANNLADGFYAATLRLQRENRDESSDE